MSILFRKQILYLKACKQSLVLCKYTNICLAWVSHYPLSEGGLISSSGQLSSLTARHMMTIFPANEQERNYQWESKITNDTKFRLLSIHHFLLLAMFSISRMARSSSSSIFLFGSILIAAYITEQDKGWSSLQILFKSLTPYYDQILLKNRCEIINKNFKITQGQTNYPFRWFNISKLADKQVGLFCAKILQYQNKQIIRLSADKQQLALTGS